MIKQVKDQIEQSKKVLKILESEELEQIANIMSEIYSNFRIETCNYPPSVSLWLDSVKTEILPELLRTAARHGWRNRNRNFKIDLNDLFNNTKYLAWYLENKEVKNIKINLLVPSKFTNCQRIIVGYETIESAEVPVYEIHCN